MFQATWKTFRSRFGPLIANLRRHKHLVESQASLAQFEEIQKLRLQAESEFRSIREAEDRRRRSEVLEWLSPANVEEDQERRSLPRGRYPNVCSWILKEKSVHTWINPSKNHGKPLLWINGIPGSGTSSSLPCYMTILLTNHDLGKSTIASFLVEELRKTSSTPTLFFYCKHEDKERNSFPALARALIQQAVCQSDDLLSFVYEEAATCGEKPLKSAARAEKVLDLALKSLGPVYIIIDGLDECDVSETPKITSWFIRYIHEETQLGNSHTRCLILSQDDKETHRLLKLVPQISITEGDVASDIKSFCKIEGSELKWKFGLAQPECDGIINRVVDEAHGKRRSIKHRMQ